MKIIVAKNYREMSKIAADLVVRQIKRKPASVLGLATGHTPFELYDDLVQAYRRGKVSFKKVKTFNLDEYAGLGENNRSSCHYYMKNKFFKKVDLSKKNIFIPDGRAADLKKECAAYERKIRRAGGVDLQILGIGLDGHIGFNEPGSNFSSKTRLVKLAESTRRANAKYFGGRALVPQSAVTMGLGTILKAKKVILLASGREKAAIVKLTLRGKADKITPASVLRKHPQVTVILDKTAAELIKLPK